MIGYCILSFFGAALILAIISSIFLFLEYVLNKKVGFFETPKRDLVYDNLCLFIIYFFPSLIILDQDLSAFIEGIIRVFGDCLSGQAVYILSFLIKSQKYISSALSIVFFFLFLKKAVEKYKTPPA